MTNLADADLHGPAVGPTSWPSPANTDSGFELPPPPPPATSPAASPVESVAMPAPLAHQPTAVSSPELPLSPEVADTTSAVTSTDAPSLQPNADPAATPALASTPAPALRPEPQPVALPTSDPAPTVAAAIVTGPAAILAPVDAVAPLDDAAIILPSVAPAVAPTAPAAASQAAAQAAAKAAVDSLLMPGEPAVGAKKKRKKSGGSSFKKFVMTAAVLGGLGYAGATYGPGLYDEYVGEEAPTEPAAPLAFPRSRTTAPEVRTATFVLDGLATGSEASYTITVDFDTAVSRVAIDRTDGPDLEVLTFANDALVRRLDSSSWFQMERGAFPLDDQLQQTDWIRMIDDVIPAERRAGVLIDSSTLATVAGVETRHLVLTLDPELLELADETGAALDPIGDITDAADGVAGDSTPAATPLDVDATAPPAGPGTPAGDPAASPSAPEAAPEATGPAEAADDSPSQAVETVPVAGEPMSPNAIQVEIWIDQNGVVRRSVGADVLGANSITILETTAEAWVPDYPDATQVRPVTAAALIELGL